MGNGNRTEGINYVLTNKSMPGFIKIGSTIDLTRRMKELDNGSIPLPFECFHASRVKNMIAAEKALQATFESERVRSTREFFKMDPERVARILRAFEIEDVTPRLENVTDKVDIEALEKFQEEEEEKKRRTAFRFPMAKIDNGYIIYFARDQKYTATVVSDKTVEFEGEELSLSAATNKILVKYFSREPGTNTADGSGAWMYKEKPEDEGERLNARRLRIEQEESELRGES
jgi:hypothetical protein